MRMDKGKPFMHVKEDGGDATTFSEAFLYETVGKYEARFILGVAEEYEHVIEALGPAAVRAILDVKPRLVNRLGTGAKIVEWLEDARSDRGEHFDKQYPPQIILDDNSMELVWGVLHTEYRRYFDPENDMDKNMLRAYHALTDALGQHEKEQRQKEIDRLPEKLKAKEEREKAHQERVARKHEVRDARDAVLAAARGEGDTEAALKLYAEVHGKDE